MRISSFALVIVVSCTAACSVTFYDLFIREVDGNVHKKNLEIAKNDAPASPSRVVIPSIGLDASIEHVGINNKGEMAVPSGTSDNVGWYKYGTVPGEVGSAVFDAHVYAAFNNLKNVATGSEVLVRTKDDQVLRFVVRDIKTFELEDLSPELLFNQSDGRRLNLITCAGRYVDEMDTYTHRLVVFAEFTGTVS